MTGHFLYNAMNANGNVLFPFTLEKVEAVVAGLEPTPQDEILAIAGCGDQALALLESGASVTVVDVNQSQLDLIEKRIHAMQDDDITGFYGSPIDEREIIPFQDRLKYFEPEERHEKIKQKLGNLKILKAANFESVLSEKTFSKVYASDAIGELYCVDPLEAHLSRVARGIRPEGLLYISNGPEISNLVKDISPTGLTPVESLSERARSFEYFYRPTVYQKK